MSFRKAKITIRVVEALKPGETIADAALPGFMVRRQKGDARIYFIRKAHNSVRHFQTIGEHGVGWTESAARAEAQILLGGIKKGETPAAIRLKAKGAPTLEACIRTFIDQRRNVTKDGTLYNYECFLRNYISSTSDDSRTQQRLGPLRIDQITRAQLSALHRSLQDKPRAANHLLAMLSVVFEEARKARLIAKDAENPTQNIKRYKERKRERFLTADEITRIGEAFKEVERHGTDQFAIAAIRLLILTGCRKNEILKARWSWVDLDRGFLNLPDSKSGAKTVYLGPPAIDLLRALPRIVGNQFVFPGRNEGDHFKALQHVWERVRVIAKLEPMQLPNGKIEHVRLHDLRHSFASIAVSGGASLPMIGKLFGHSQWATTQRYAHLADDPLRRVNDLAASQAAAALQPAEEAKT
jgi:integrase